VTILGLANRLGGPVTAGLSLAADSAIFAVARGYAVYRLDANLDEVFDLQVNGDIFSSASIGADTAVYFGSTDKSLYGFTHFGAPLWPSLPLGGILSSTPTIDSVGDRIFVGVQNRNLFCIDRATGHVVWNYFTDAPIDQSAVITVDRKLVFTTKKGTIYGFDLNALPVPPAPSWSFALGDTVTSSPAVDAGANIYVGTSSGKVMKVILQRDIPVSVAWQCVLGGSVIASPVIDAAGTLYAGSLDSALYAIDVVSGVVKWSRKTAGPIRSTPAISNEGTIFVGNDAGEFRAYDGTGDLKWRYLHTAPIRSPILWNDGMVYFGTEDSLVIALRERPSLISTRAILAGMTPVWGTFQGNNSRTGMQSPNNLSSVVTATGWNIVSVHLMTPDQRPSALFPAATTPAYAFHGDYVTAAALLPGTGYWMKFPSAGVVFQQGTPIVAETVAVTSGWNLIGSVGSAIPVASVSSIPGGMTTSSFWEYVGGFQAATMITPGRGYFVKVAQPGSLILSSAGTAQVANHIHIALTDELPPSPPSASGAQESGVPDRFSLADPYPSPFNPSTTIQYTLPVGSRVSIRVYNILGECVGTLVEGAQSAGVHAVVWDAGMIASGLYIVRMEALDVHGGNESHVFAKKVILLR
jgi:outer membrane protein assembly factor BamB